MSDPTDLAAVRDALLRWIDALQHPSDAARIAAAVEDDIEIHRYPPALRRDGVPPRGVEPVVLRGLDAVSAWVQRTPAEGVFTLAGALTLAGDDACVEYGYAYGDFRNGGVWMARARGARLVRLVHAPFALDDDHPYGPGPLRPEVAEAALAAGRALVAAADAERAAAEPAADPASDPADPRDP